MQVIVPLGGPYAKNTTCAFRAGQTMRYRGKNRAYVVTVTRRTLAHKGSSLEHACVVASRDETLVHYRGSMSRLDGPCHIRHNNVFATSRFAWKVHGKTVRAGGLPVEENSENYYLTPEFTQKWSAGSGHYHRHSGPAYTYLIRDDQGVEDGVSARIIWAYLWYSRGYEHRAKGPCYVKIKTHANADWCTDWARYGIQH